MGPLFLTPNSLGRRLICLLVGHDRHTRPPRGPSPIEFRQIIRFVPRQSRSRRLHVHSSLDLLTVSTNTLRLDSSSCSQPCAGVSLICFAFCMVESSLRARLRWLIRCDDRGKADVVPVDAQSPDFATQSSDISSLLLVAPPSFHIPFVLKAPDYLRFLSLFILSCALRRRVSRLSRQPSVVTAGSSVFPKAVE